MNRLQTHQRSRFLRQHEYAHQSLRRDRPCRPIPTPSLTPDLDGILTASTVVSSASAILLTALCCPTAATSKGVELHGGGPKRGAVNVQPGGGDNLRGADEDNLPDDDEDNLQWAVASLTSCIPLLSFVVSLRGLACPCMPAYSRFIDPAQGGAEWHP